MLSLLTSNPLLGLEFIFWFLISATLHEVSHAYTASRLGDTTAEEHGRINLNPLSHIDPLGAMSFLLIGFGWFKPVPYNPNRLHGRFDELKIALAGPITNILIAFILSLPYRYFTLRNLPLPTSPLFQALEIGVTLNLMLAAFNILPIPPLDGSKIIMIFLSNVQKLKFQFYGQYILLGLVFFGLISGVNIFSLILIPLINLLAILTRTTIFLPPA